MKVFGIFLCTSALILLLFIGVFDGSVLLYSSTFQIIARFVENEIWDLNRFRGVLRPRFRIRIRMSFIGQVCLHIRGICYSDKAPQCNRMTATGQDTDNKRTIYKYTNIQIGNVQNSKNTMQYRQSCVYRSDMCKFEMKKIYILYMYVW